MGFNPPVPQQDSNWEIRAAVLLSLFFQVLLIFLGPTRKRSSAALLRLTVWSSYLLADWVADLALGLLLNNMGNIGGNNDNTGTASSPVIFAFWMPFLLLHQGGPDTITAYSVEDNELWNRHLISLLFELFSASVIIFCSLHLHGNPLVPATMLMLVAGVIKYGERTYSLYAGSAESLRDSILGPPELSPNYSRLITEFHSKKKAGLSVELAIYNVQKEIEITQGELYADILRAKSMEAQAYQLFLTFRCLLVDVIISSKERRLSQAFFLRRRSDEDETTVIQRSFEVIEAELDFMYDMVYTKAPVAHSKAGWVVRCICSGCLVSALAVFFFIDKPGHQILRVDVGITYALLLGRLALDAAALLMIFSDRAKVYPEESSRRLHWLSWASWLRRVTKRCQTRRWSGKTSQLNLISHALGKPDRFGKGAAFCLKVASCLHIVDIDIVDEFVFIRRVRLEKDKENVSEYLLFGFVFRGLKGALRKLKEEQEERKKAAADQKLPKMEQEAKAAAPAPAAGTPDQEATTEEEEMEAEKEAMAEKDAIAEVCRRRGDGVVKSLEDDIKRGKGTKEGDARFKVILDSVVKSEFDESLLLWHIATDLCLQRNYQGPMPEGTTDMRAIAETLSEYMLYLLIKQPDMLAATAGIGLIRYRDTCAEARQFFDSMAAWNPDHEDARRMLLSVNTSKKPVQVALRELHEEYMWDVITGVWGEMLTFAAGKCRGSMHVRQLSRGGEFITLVWFLMAHMGLGDMYQIQEGDANAKLIINDQ